MPKLILMFNVTVAAAAGHEQLSMLQLHSASSTSIDLVGSARVHLDISTFPDIECALSEAVVTEEEEERRRIMIGQQ